jgi:uncharacterized membrane protein YfcA
MNHNQGSDSNDPMAAWMRQLANDPLERSHRPLPDPDLLWMKAQLLNRQAAAERSLRVVRWFETLFRVLAGFAASLMAVGIAKGLHLLPIGLLTSTQNQTAASLAIAVLLVAASLVLFPIWSED